MKPFLILQLRKNDLVSKGEFDAILKYGDMNAEDVFRMRMDSDELTDINLEDYSGIIVGGGPWNVSDAQEKKSERQLAAEAWLSEILRRVVAKDFPYFGACYGLGLLAREHGGLVSKEKYGEAAGSVTIKLKPEAQDDPLLTGLPSTFQAFTGHKEACQELPNGAVWLASSEQCPYNIFRIGKNVYTTQFHPELDNVGVCDRIDVYKNEGYFPPEEAEALKERCKKEEISVPMEILRRFVEKYR
ncbi:MAG: glutamine amidotransferase [Parcubacteria group bacterium]|nr:glutamine amidotransferase [Parcubacteria group bacterium]